MEVDKFRLIEEVRKRPNLWDCQSTSCDRNNRNFSALWDEIAKALKTKSTICKHYWQQLRTQFCSEVNRIKKRIEKAKSKGQFNPNKKYYTWIYFDALIFLAHGRGSTAQYDLTFMQHSGVEVGKHSRANPTQHQLDNFLANSSLQTESDSDIEIVEQNSTDNLQYKKRKYFQYESDNDNEFINITNIDEPKQNQGEAEIDNCTVKNLKGVQENMGLTSTPTVSHSSDNLSSTSDIDPLFRFRLIEEVRKRPDLWSINPLGRNNKKFKALFDEIGKVLKVEPTKCKDIWQHLRSQFWSEVKRIRIRIETARSNGEYNPYKIYYSWVYFDALTFLASAAQYDLPFMKKRDIEAAKNNKIYSEVFPDDNSLQTESENDMEIIENENYYDRENDMEFIDTTSLDERQSQIENQSNTFQYNPVVKNELELQIEVENSFLENEDIKEVAGGKGLSDSLDNSNSSYISDTNQLDKFRLIEEVKMRPCLWDCQTTSCDKNNKKCTALWDEIGEVLKVKSTTCMHHWQQLRTRFCDEVERIESRIIEHDTNEEYHTWIYFDSLMFLAHRRAATEQYDLTFMKNTDVDIEKSCKRNLAPLKRDFSLDSETESETETKKIEYKNSNKLKCSKRKYFENNYESDSDMEFIDSTSLDKPESTTENEQIRLQDTSANRNRPEPHIQTKHYPVESENITDVGENETLSHCLDDPNPFPISDINQLDKFRLIEEVRKRPGLWDCQGTSYKKDIAKFNDLWADVGKVLSANAYTCRRLWQKLRIQFCNEVPRINRRVTEAKKDGKFDPAKKYYTWNYFEALIFLLKGRGVRTKYDLSFMGTSNSETNKISEKNSEQSSEVFFDGDLLEIESENQIDNEKDSDIEIIDSSLDETQSQIENERHTLQNSTVVKNKQNLNIESENCSVENENVQAVEENKALSNSPLISNINQLDRYRLIEQVKKRPGLWNRLSNAYNKSTLQEHWTDIGKVLKAKGSICKRLWQILRIQFCNEVHRVDQRVREAKENGNYDPNKKYYTWVYLEDLIFAANKRALKQKYDLGIMNNYIEMDMNDRTNNTDFQSKNLLDSNVFLTENDSDIEIMECESVEKLKPRKRKSQGYYYESDTDIDAIDSNNSNELQPHIENEKNTLEAEKVVENEAEFQPEMENCPVQNVAEVPENHSPTLSIPAESHSPDNSAAFPTSNECEFLDQVTFSTENNISANDQDCSFLYSFLLPTKVMNQLQKMEFHANMKRLLEHILPGSSTVNTLENDLLLPDESDLDMKFLMSFLPFIKSMSLIQNLQFRSNMSDLVLQILSTDAIV